MKKFNQFMEAVLVAKIIPVPSSDAVSPVEQCDACGDKPKDMFNAATDDFMKDMGFEGEKEVGAEGSEEMIQPTDGVGEAGEIESEGSDGVELTCMGEEGLEVNFNGMKFVLPKNVIEAIKDFEAGDGFGHEEGSTEEENEDHEESESPAEEEAEHAEGGSEEDKSEPDEDVDEDDEDKKNPFTESQQIPIVYKVKRKSSTNEWVVAAYVNGKFDENKSYFTDDKQDAIGTMKYMQEHDPFVKTPVTEAKKVNPWAVCNASTGGKKKAGGKFEKCVLDVKKKSGIKK